MFIVFITFVMSQLSAMKYIFSYLLIILSFCVNAQDGRKILLKSYDVLKRHKSVEYNCIVRSKSFNSDDTSSINAKVYILRTQDTIFESKLWYSQNDTFYQFYDMKNIYKVDGRNKKVTKYNPHKKEAWALTGNTLYDVVWQDFIDPKRIMNRINNAVSIVKLTDTLIDGALSFNVKLILGDSKNLTDHVYNIYISKRDNIPIMIRRKVKFQGNYQFDEFLLKNYAWDKVPSLRFSPNQIPSDYVIATYQRKQDDFKLQDNNSLAPLISGRNLQQALKIDTIKYEGKITVLDFWYMACHPCILAIPQMEKLREKYISDKRVQIIGINAYDNEDKNIKKFPKFLQHNPINYPIFLVEKNLPDKFLVNAWPTFCIVQNGKIVFTITGYNDKIFEDLQTQIEILLKKM